MSFLKPKSFKDLIFNLLALTGLGIFMVAITFYIWLPSSTNHGETISVPDIQGMHISELKEFLSKRTLRYEIINDSSYSPNFDPLTVLRQVPPPNSKVKENRKIYISLNAETPPKIRMPKMVDLSLKAAQMVLKSYGLKLGEIEYVPDPNIFGTVHEARSGGRVILEGEKIEKGSVIDLAVGDGYGNQTFESPNLIGLEQEEAEVVIVGTGLKVGKIVRTRESSIITTSADDDGSEVLVSDEVGPGRVQKQSPTPGTSLAIGDVVNIWIYQPDSVQTSSNATLLDN